MDDALHAHLEELEDLIRRSNEDGEIDATERAQIAALVERVRDDLAAADPDHGTIRGRLEDSARRFEAEHPTIAAVFHSAAQTLTGYGM